MDPHHRDRQGRQDHRRGLRAGRRWHPRQNLRAPALIDIQVRPTEPHEYRHIVDYFHDSPDELLQLMGVDRQLLPPRDTWLAALQADHGRAAGDAERIWLTWLAEGEPIGHSSINHIMVGERANIHLHMWRPNIRRKGLGTAMFELCVEYAFDHLDIAHLYCEPCAANPAPNHIVKKLGFELVETRWTRPGPINFAQQTNVYVLARAG